jgi:biotin carboxylase
VGPTMRSNRVVVIGGGAEPVRRASELGLAVVLVHDPNAFNFVPEITALCEEFLPLAFADAYPEVERAVLERHAECPFAHVFSFDEDGLVAAARLNQLMGLGGNRLLPVLTLKDKALMRRTLAEHELSPVRYRLVRELDELIDFLDAIGGPAVVKPLDGTASMDVHVVADRAGASAAWAELQARGYRRVLAEEELVGPEFSVDTLSRHGRHLVIAITRKYLAGSLEVGHSMPSDLPAHEHQALCTATSDLLDAVGITDGPAHTEVRLTSDGPRIIESQNRIGGSRLPELMWRSMDVDITRLSIAVAVGLAPLPVEPPVTLRGAAVRHLVPRPGRVLRVEGIEQVPRDGTVSIRLGVGPGDVVIEQRTSYDRYAVNSWVVATGRDEAEAIARCESVRDSVRIVTEPTGAVGGVQEGEVAACAESSAGSPSTRT